MPKSFCAICQHYHSIKETETELIRKLEQKEIQLFPIICLQEQLCISKTSKRILFLMLSHQGTISVQASIKVVLMENAAEYPSACVCLFFHVCKTWPQTCRRLAVKLQSNVLTYAYWIVHDILNGLFKVLGYVVFSSQNNSSYKPLIESQFSWGVKKSKTDY